VVLGDAAVGADFAHLPFDHLLFTARPRLATTIMRMAADNLTPVTLESGQVAGDWVAPTIRWQRRPSGSWSASC